MKRIASLAAVLLAAACHSHPSTNALDFSQLADRDVAVTEFVSVCQRASGYNFTYAESTNESMKGKTVRVVAPGIVPAAEFDGFLTEHLSTCGLQAKPVGPTHLNVLLIEPRTR
jgi:hypothetical protein